MKQIFIVNPTSGYGKGLAISNVIEEIYKNNNIDYKIEITKEPLHAISLAKKYSTDLDVEIIYVIGGDRFINEVVNGMANSNKLLSIIPTGKNNNIARIIYDKKLTEKDLAIDLGKVNDTYFIGSAILGIGAPIINSVNNSKYHGIRAYLESILDNYYDLEQTNIITNYHGKRYNCETITLLSVNNGKYSLNDNKMVNYTSFSDGLLDVVMVNEISSLKLKQILLKILFHIHFYDKDFRQFKTNNLIVQSLEPIMCSVDNNIIEGSQFNFQSVKNALTIRREYPEMLQKILKHNLK